MADYKKILIIRLDRIGDVLLSTPVFRAVKEAFPESSVSVMVRPYALEVVRGNPSVDRVIVYDKDGAEGKVPGTLGLIRDLRRERFDLALVLHPSNRSHLIAFLAGIPVRVGYAKKLGSLLTTRIPHKKELGLKHEIDYALDLARAVGAQPSSRELFMPLSGASEAKARKIFSDHSLAHGPVVAIHPAASCPSKRWPLERFADAAARLAARHGAKAVVLAGGDSSRIGDRLAGMMSGPGVINLSGMTTVSDLASVLVRCSVLVSNDSGPVHVACAVKTPVVAIFGRSDRGLSPARWGPTGERDIVLHKYVGCEECLAHNCRKGFECLKAVTVDEVVAACGRILSHRAMSQGQNPNDE